mmetsp:Transcript_8290/g.25611  ORF Transcript_8290/g.25611 Transcript_8290/m.25611 type:complete len:197 (+) Transcript_8290:41-631(+)
MRRGAEDSRRALHTRAKQRNATASDFEQVPAPTYVFEQIRWASPRDHPLGLVVKTNAGDLTRLLGADAQIHNAQFFVGNALSGAPLHYHSHAVNALLAGKKRWLLFPPAESAYSTAPAASWLRPDALDALRRRNVSFLTCLQTPDTALFLPAGWGHAVLNLEDGTVGAAFEFHWPGELTWSMEDRAADVLASNRRL